MFEIAPHTGDVRVRVSSPTLEDLYRDSLAAMMTYVDATPDLDATSIRREVTIESADRTTLLIDFLNDALTLSIIGREMYNEIHFRALGDTMIDAMLVGTRAAFGDEIKAVTYHEAEVVQNADGSWSTVLVFDI